MMHTHYCSCRISA